MEFSFRHTMRRRSALLGDCGEEPGGLWSASRCALKFAVTAGLLVMGLCAAVPAADNTPQIDRIEEDWELVVQTPEPNDDAPQITTVMSPFGNLDGMHCVFELNHATQPEYSSGGLQLQLWYGDNLYASRRQHPGKVLRAVNETVTWTTRMSIAHYDNWLRFEVLNGVSTSWGAFGRNQELRKGGPSNLSHLLNYSPSASVSNSRVGFASNRVTRLTLKRVRYYVDNTLIATDETPRVVFEPNDSVESLD